MKLLPISAQHTGELFEKNPTLHRLLMKFVHNIQTVIS